MTLPKAVSEAINEHGDAQRQDSRLAAMGLPCSGRIGRARLTLEAAILAALTEAREGALRERNEAQGALRAVVVWQGIGHEDDCSEDEDCECELVARVNAALASRPEPAPHVERPTVADIEARLAEQRRAPEPAGTPRQAFHLESLPPGHSMCPPHSEKGGRMRTLTVVVGGEPAVMVSPQDERVGVLVHRTMAAEGYDWTSFEIRDEAGRLLPPGTPSHEIAGQVYVSRPIGWGG